MIPRLTREAAIARLVEAANLLSIQELGELVDHLREGTLTEVKSRKWGHHVADFLPDDGDSHTIYLMWATLIDIHSDLLDEQ